MKTSHLMAVLAAAILSISLAATWVAGQQAPPRTAVQPPRSAPTVALLDVSRVFKNYSRFKTMMDGMKANVEQAEGWFKTQRDAIQTLSQKLKGFRPGTPDYKATEEELARRNADLAIKVKLQKREFLEREAKIYHTAYTEIVQEVNYYCARNGIAMVLRFNGDPVDANAQPQETLAYINRPVVWHNQGLDITQVISDSLNRRAGAAPGSNSRPGVGVRPAYPPQSRR